jgi:hypothetical protein
MYHQRVAYNSYKKMIAQNNKPITDMESLQLSGAYQWQINNLSDMAAGNQKHECPQR